MAIATGVLLGLGLLLTGLPNHASTALAQQGGLSSASVEEATEPSLDTGLDKAIWLPFKGSYVITCGYQTCIGPYHSWRAIDFGIPVGTPLYASAPGTVVKVHTGCQDITGRDYRPSSQKTLEQKRNCGSATGKTRGYGNHVVVEHVKGKLYTLYGHMTSVSVKDGDFVHRGWEIGESGNTGFTETTRTDHCFDDSCFPGEHLHFEARSDGGTLSDFAIDPGPMYAFHGDELMKYEDILSDPAPAYTNDDYTESGRLLRVPAQSPTSGAELHWVQNGTSYHVAPGIREEMYDLQPRDHQVPGWNPTLIKDITRQELNDLAATEGPALISSDGSSDQLLVRRFRDEKRQFDVLYIDNRNPREVQSPEAMEHYGFSFFDVIDVAPSILDDRAGESDIPPGKDIYAVGRSDDILSDGFVDGWNRLPSDADRDALGFATGDIRKGDRSPVGDELDGTFQLFDRGALELRSGDPFAFAVRTGMWDCWSGETCPQLAKTFSASCLGWPTDNEYAFTQGNDVDPRNRRQNFEGGYIYWVPPNNPLIYDYAPGDDPSTREDDIPSSSIKDDCGLGSVFAVIPPDPPSTEPPATPINDAQGEANPSILNLHLGEQIPIELTFTNDGTKSWTEKGNYELARSTADALLGTPSSLSLEPGERIQPGQSRSWQVFVQGAANPGTYTQDWQMSQVSNDRFERTFFGDPVPIEVTILPPTLAISPSSGEKGTIFEPSGDGFWPEQTATIHFQQVGGGHSETFSVDTDSTGSFTTAIGSAFLDPGTYEVFAIDDTTGAITNMVEFTVLAPIDPTVEISPSIGLPGTIFTISGSDFTPNGTVTSHLQRPDGSELSTLSLTTDANGQYAHAIDSSGFSIGVYTHWAVEESTGVESNRVDFEITTDRDLAGLLVGVVTDEVSGEPLSDVQVFKNIFDFFDGFADPLAVTDSNGVYELTGAEVGSETGGLVFVKDGYFREESFYQITLPLPTTLDVALHPSVTLFEGTIRDAVTGDPIQGATVSFHTFDFALSPQVTTDAQGHYQIEGTYFQDSLLDGFEAHLFIQAQGYLDASRGPIQAIPPFPYTADDIHIIPAE